MYIYIYMFDLLLVFKMNWWFFVYMHIKLTQPLGHTNIRDP